MADDDGNQTGDSIMFGIFLFSITLLFLVPVTCWRVSSGAGATMAVDQPWLSKAAKQSLTGKAGRYVNGPNIAITIVWILMLCLGVFLSKVQIDQEVFEPYKILGLEKGADLKDVKHAYQNLAKRYHPDRNKTAEAAVFFTEQLTPAYNTLTNVASKENFDKYGHPDGPGTMNIGVALPEWVFTSDKRAAPLVLFGLVFIGLAIPILLISVYLYQTDQVVGPNAIMEQTLYMYTRVCVKEFMRAPKVAEQLIMSNEYATMPMNTSKDGKAAWLAFVKRMTREYDLADKKAIWNLVPNLIRAYLFVTAHLNRNTAIIPIEMLKEYKETLRWAPVLAEEFVKAACVPRNKFYQGWFCPAEAAVQFQQCVTHAVRPDILVPVGDSMKNKKKTVGSNVAELMMLPGVSEDVIRSLEKKHKIKTLVDLVSLSPADREVTLEGCGVDSNMLEDISKVLVSLPHIQVTSAKLFVDGETDIKEQDLVSVEAYVTLTRPSHESLNGKSRSRGGGVQAFATRFPHPVTEKWWIFVVHLPTNSVWAHTTVDLQEAESIGIANVSTLGCKWNPNSIAAATLEDTSQATPAAPDTDGETDETPPPPPVGQKLEVKFMAPEAGKYDLTLVIMSSCWLGCDLSHTTAVKILALSHMEKQGLGPARGSTAQPTSIPLDEDEKEEKKAKKKANIIGENGDVSSDEESSDEDDDDDEDWDTEETGSSISHSDSESDDDEADDKTKKTA